MELQLKKTGGKNAENNRIMDKLHYGYDIKTGVSGYDAVKQCVKNLRNDGYQINDRTVLMVLASKFDKKTDDAIKTLETALAETSAFLQTATAEQIAEKLGA